MVRYDRGMGSRSTVVVITGTRQCPNNIDPGHCGGEIVCDRRAWTVTHYVEDG
jgi:hypothetical protein